MENLMRLTLWGLALIACGLAASAAGTGGLLLLCRTFGVPVEPRELLGLGSLAGLMAAICGAFILMAKNKERW